jgi:hypothetical protein
MRLVMSLRPSPAIVVAVLALIAGVAGTAVAGPDASTSVNKKKTKKIAKKIGKKQVNKLAPGIADAEINKLAPGIANQEIDKRAPEFKTAGANAERTDNLDLAGTAFEEVLSTTINSPGDKKLILSASAEAEGDGGNNDEIACVIAVDGVDSPSYGQVIPDFPFDEATVALVDARDVGAGNHSLALRCREVSGNVVIDDAALVASAVG